MPPLPTRAGERPRTTPTNPHTQLDQQPTDLRWFEELAERVFALPGVVEDRAASRCRGPWRSSWHPVRRSARRRPSWMLYAPRDEAELDVIEGLVRASHAFARPG